MEWRPLRKHRETTLFESLAVVADRAGVTSTTISMIERGHHVPRKINFKKLAAGYKLTVKRFVALMAIPPNNIRRSRRIGRSPPLGGF